MRKWIWLVFLALFLVALGSGRVEPQSRFAAPIPGNPGVAPVTSDARTWEQLENISDGIKLQYPGDWQVEVIPGVATILTKTDYVKLVILVQPLGQISAEEYVLYSNRSLEEGWGGIRLLSRRQLYIHGYPAWQFEWTRRQLTAGDLNYYREYHLVAGKTVYTFM
ncbi:MAG: hypothetical protein H5T99_11650, partial [Moorella sp. (in: Bacteria)]|nr:hypothetical protein [Moorella sp. (in: firmicutes)]